jgi:outer membrane immunogenic protein
MPPPFSWTGFYLGGNLGGAWGHGNVTDVFNPGINFNGGNTNNGVFMGGGQAGFNYQVGSAVFGLEGTFDWAANNNNTTTGVITACCGTVSVTSNDRWISTVAGRLGWAWDHWLLYGKGGGAWVGNNNFTVLTSAFGSFTGTNNNTSTGWVAGVGFEWAFTNNWTLKLEYNYIGLSSRTIVIPTAFLGLGGDVFTTGSNNVQTVVVGINYLFNWGAPVTARY